jgi:hypothetical protein
MLTVRAREPVEHLHRVENLIDNQDVVRGSELVVDVPVQHPE